MNSDSKLYQNIKKKKYNSAAINSVFLDPPILYEMTKIIVLQFLVFCLVALSCQPNRPISSLHHDSIEEADTSRLAVSVKGIFYSVPTPIETVFLIKNAGVGFEKQILNPISYLQQYVTSKEKAINLGIYSLDMCYANLNHQQDLLVGYLTGVKKLSSDLGILADFDQTTVAEIEQNINDHDYIFKQIAERFLRNTEQQTLDRKLSGAYIMVGTYIEGLYVTLHHAAKLAEPDANLLNCLVQQGISLTKILSLLLEFKAAELKNVHAELQSVRAVLSKFRLEPDELTSPNQIGDVQNNVLDAFHLVKKLRNAYVD